MGPPCGQRGGALGHEVDQRVRHVQQAVRVLQVVGQGGGRRGQHPAEAHVHGERRLVPNLFAGTMPRKAMSSP